MTFKLDWIKSERIVSPGQTTLQRHERRDGAWRVEETPYFCLRQFYVMQKCGGSGHWTATHHFRKRFATPEAAMRAVDRKFPLET